MAQLLERCGIRLTPGQLEQLWAYHNLLRERNGDRDLTRITGFVPMVLKHYVDCMVVGDHVRIPSPVVDVGTGAGFPGIPLKIRYPQLEMILAEPRPRRVAFLREASAKLKFKNVSVFEHKVTSKSFQTPVAAVVTRALEPMEKTLLRTSGALQPGGSLIFLKGPAVDEEIGALTKRFGDKVSVTSHVRYKIPILDHERRLVVVTVKRALTEMAALPHDDEDTEIAGEDGD